MSMIISDECICCDVCEPECPNGAILMGDEHYEVDPEKCTECVGYYDEPQCVEVCPVESLSRDESRPESREELQAKFDAMTIGR
jgi:ferredoxin